MKLYKYLISGGLALTLSLSSCESWLEVEPNDTRTTDYFYSTGTSHYRYLQRPASYFGLFLAYVGSSFRQCVGG